MRVLSKLKKPKATRILGGALGLLLVLTLVLMPAVPALAVEGIPHWFHGTVTIGTGLAPEGTIVSAQIDGVQYGDPMKGESYGTVDAEGRYGYCTDYGGTGTFMVPADDLDTPEKEGGVAGETVEFYITNEAMGLDGVKANETALFENFGTTELNLTVGEAPDDTTPPTVTIASTATPLTNTSPIPMTATFSEDVTGFELSDIDVTNGTAGNFAGSGADYTFEVTATGEVAVTVDIAAGVAEDAATNGNEAAPTFTIDFDDVAPTVTIASTATSPTNTSPIPMTATFSEDVTGFVVGDITVTNGTAGNFAGSGAVYTFDVTPVAAGAVTVDIATGVAHDAATNPNEAATQFSIIYTTVVPAVTINPVTSPTNTATQSLTGTRSAGLTVVLTSAEATFEAVTYPTTTTWSCYVTLVEGSNGITATADTSTATATIVLDTAAPTVVSKSPAAGAPGVAVGTTVSVTFSEAMDESTITTDSFTLDSVSGSVSYSSGTYTATFTPSDNLTLDTTYTANLSTAITDAVGNPLDEAYSWSFTTATVSLGDLIDEILAAGEDTLELPAGTYSGDITIDEPITITGIEGETIISGGITIGELTGSEVIIENLTITDYTDFGIRIVKVGAVDTFVIQNNTILGVEGSLIGIEVVEVEGGGILNIRKNAISGNEVGIKLLANVADATIHFNDITDNTVFGLEQLAVVSNASTFCNWWGDISGPEYEAASFQYWPNNPGGLGDAVSDNVGFTPWLTRDFQTVLDDNIAYFGYPMVWLYTGWNIMSTPVALDPACDTWGEYVDLGDGLDVHATSPAYRFNSQTQAWVALTSDDTLDPCDAIYVRMASDDIAAIVYSPNLSVPSKELYAGWNLVSLAWIHREEYAKPANEALVTVEEVAGGLTGYKLVVSPGVNAYETSWIYIAGDSIEPWTDPEAPPDGWMWMTSGYWVFMLNDGTLAGFTFTPMSLGM